jgi:GGDEF domain-containing protein
MRRMAQDSGVKKREGHILLIDIRGFKEINRTFGFEKADRLLRVIAQDLHKSMQRREDIYKKRPATDFSSGVVDPSVYRKYAGGDEFLFLINGNLSAALGYINRQRKQFETLSKLTSDILGKHRDLSFQCGIARIFWPDAESAQVRLNSALDNVSECYIKALRVATPDKKFSICWDTNSEAEDPKWPGFRASDIGKEIEHHFSVAAWGT